VIDHANKWQTLEKRCGVDAVVGTNPTENAGSRLHLDELLQRNHDRPV